MRIVQDIRSGKCFPKSIAENHGHVTWCMRQKRDKLLAPEPGGKILSAAICFQDFGKRGKYFVACAMSQGIVYLLEMIKIHHYY